MCFCWFEEAAGDILSAAEAQDLNEGRTHLRAVADRRGVPVFGTVKQAVENIFTQHTKTENNTAQSPKALKSEHVAGALEKEAFSEPSWHYISSKTRDIGKMVQAAEMVSGKNVDNLVLVIEEDEDAEKKDEQFALGQEIADEIISAAQAKDLNRGRSYLRDVANRHGVPVYKTIEEAYKAMDEKNKKINESVLF